MSQTGPCISLNTQENATPLVIAPQAAASGETVGPPPHVAYAHAIFWLAYSTKGTIAPEGCVRQDHILQWEGFVMDDTVVVKQSMWTSNEMIAVYIVLGLAAAAVGVWFLVRKTLRTRIDMARILRQDPDIDDWLVIFAWTQKVLYVPTMLAAVLASVLMFLHESGWHTFAGIDPKVVGGVWFGIFFLNFLVEEYNINIRVLLITFASLGCLLLWLHLLGAVLPFLRLFGHLAFSISGMGYLLIAVIGLLTVGISWLHGLFHYVAITPNYADIQYGPTESGEQIGREDYNTKIDTSDFLERLLGFGRISITFKDKSRPPLTLLVWRVHKKAEMLEQVRATLAVDHPPQAPTQPPTPPTPPQAGSPQGTIG
jgi:hypothetical protein